MKKTLIRNIVKHIAFSLFICTIAASGIIVGTSQTNGGFGQEDIYAASKTSSVKVKIKKAEKKYKKEDGTVVMDASYEKPVLTGSTSAIKKINKFYTTAKTSYFNDYKKMVNDGIKNGEFDDDFGLPYGDAVNTTVTYNKNGIISILQEGYFYSGGAHGNPYYVAHTFNLNTGKELKLTNIMKGTNTQIKNKIVSAFKTKLASMDGAYDDALTYVKSTAGTKSSFYLEKNKITFYYAPYNLAPYAAGFVEASIKYTAKNTFKINLK